MTAAPQILRDYQTAALEALRDSFRAKRDRRVLLVAPTGAGKTTIAAEMIRGAAARGGKVLFVAHRKELIDQCSERLDGVGVDHGIISASHNRRAPWSPVSIASVPTLIRRLSFRPEASLLVIDEAHHARAASYGGILAAYAGVPVVGLTATPWRLDNKGLGELFDDLVVAATPHQLIGQGHLVSYCGFAYDAPDLGKVKKLKGDYDSVSLEIAMSKSRIVGNIVEQWEKHCKNPDATGKRTVLFAVSVAHSREMVARFTAAGVVAEHLDGSMGKTEREGILARLRSGATTLVSNVNVLTEGFDLPALEVIILARPTLSLGLYLQMVGRGLRPAPGKAVCRIHDHAGLILRHGVPDQERDYSLAFDPKKHKRQLAPMRTCKLCLAVFPGTLSICPGCGEQLELGGGGRSGPEEIQGEQVRAIPIEQLKQKLLAFNQSQAERQAYYVEMLRRAEARGNKDGWAGYQYKNRYQTWPPRSWDPRVTCQSCNRRSFSVAVDQPICSLCLAQDHGAQLTCRRCGSDYLADGHARCPPCRRAVEEEAAARRQEMHSGAPAEPPGGGETTA